MSPIVTAFKPTSWHDAGYRKEDLSSASVVLQRCLFGMIMTSEPPMPPDMEFNLILYKNAHDEH
jgi:hypothetical protein